MVTVGLPQHIGMLNSVSVGIGFVFLTPSVAPVPAPPALAGALKNFLRQHHNMELPIIPHAGKLYVRLSGVLSPAWYLFRSSTCSAHLL
jgi:hypothetical protein